MFPKKGKYFPDRQCRLGTEVSYERTIGEALRKELRESGRKTKTVAAWTGASERSVKNWLAAKRGPSGPHLICMLRHSNHVLAAALMLAGRNGSMADQLRELRASAVDLLSRIDRVMGSDA